MSDIKLITFTTQQTIIAEIVDYGDAGIQVKNPVQVIAVPPRNSNDQGGVGFAPYLAYTEEFDKGIIIKQENVFCVTTPISDLMEQYRKMFSRIEIAPAGLKL
jgi:hypothetical protein